MTPPSVPGLAMPLASQRRAASITAALRAGVLALDRRTTELALHVGCLLLAVICGLGMWQVVTRFVLSQPSTWTEEAMRRLLIWCVMLGVVVAFRRGALVSVDLMLRVSRGWWHHTVRCLITLASLAFLATLLWFGLELTWRVRFQTFASMELSMAWAYAALPMGAALSVLAVLAQHIDPMNEELENAQ